MDVVVAPDSFGGTLSAPDAAKAIIAGWRRRRPDDDITMVPMGDGGEGTLVAVGAAVADAVRERREVANARGVAVEASWLRMPDGRALVEAAEACGLHRLPVEQRDPAEATSYGVGQLLAAVAETGATEVVVGLGGSATVDGGAGMAIALGHRLLRGDGNGLKIGARYACELERVVPLAAYPLPVVAATDVRNPLLGPDGAVAVFAGQKGATPDDLPLLEAALARFADVVERDLDGHWRDLPGAGAAGGLGFGLAGFCRARLVEGAPLIADLVGLGPALSRAALVITGEGALDAQTAAGKVAEHVRKQARAAGARVFAVAGRVRDGADAGYDAVAELGDAGLVDPAAAVAAAAESLASQAEGGIR